MSKTKKEVYLNKKGYGGSTEQFKKDIKKADIELSKLFTELASKGYRPSEICLELIQCVNLAYCGYSIRQGIEDRRKEKIKPTKEVKNA